MRDPDLIAGCREWDKNGLSGRNRQNGKITNHQFSNHQSECLKTVARLTPDAEFIGKTCSWSLRTDQGESPIQSSKHFDW